MHNAICDTSPIQYLYQIGLLDLLPEFYAQILIPTAVVDELDRGRAMGVALPDVRSLRWTKMRAPESLDQVPKTSNLGAGEREVLALGIQCPASTLILDERLARCYAEGMNRTFTGTLGILLRAKRESRIFQIEPVLKNLTQRGFRLSAKTYATILRQAGE
jgi:uncharacterized protein